MRKGSGDGATVAAVVAIIACCGVPLLAVTAGGTLAAVGGVAARYLAADGSRGRPRRMGRGQAGQASPCAEPIAA